MIEELKTEDDKVLEWREWRLTQAGLPNPAAMALAQTKGLDIEYACRVIVSVLAAGKSYELAVDILL